MRSFTIAMAGLAFVGMTGLALANPATLPQHPGYPARGEFANDAGQQNLTYSQSMLQAAESSDTNMFPTLIDTNTPTLLEHQGAGQSPIVEGANIKAEPPVKKSTKKSTK